MALLKRVLVFAVTIFVLATTCFGYDYLYTNDDVKKKTNEVMELIRNGDIDNCLEPLRYHTVLSNAQFDSGISQLRAQKSSILSNYGLVIGIELVKEQ